ncbi:hypothetical protein KAR91_86650, partial [Candidatus Pacearchaeota archaeon]|nr:hypothetical protein [Candidatus Pacearchaeota archaeon]
QQTGIKRIMLSGGVFMNVKANLKIMEIPEVSDIFVFPSCGDESNAIGGAYYGYKNLCEAKGQELKIHPIENIYWGMEFTDDEIEEYLRTNGLYEKYTITKCDDISTEVAKLLAQDEIVARVSGRMEWGARALGNRSLLANPAKYNTIRVINEKIKNRDFWMPFTPSILKERGDDYLINEKNVEAPYMSIAFRSTELARKELLAAIHPYDFTIRPQLLEQDWNPSYYKIIKEFEKITGIGGILNTSLNLHGEPIVCTPADAIHTLEDSGLKYLALGSFLITKNG